MEELLPFDSAKWKASFMALNQFVTCTEMGDGKRAHKSCAPAGAGECVCQAHAKAIPLGLGATSLLLTQHAAAGQVVRSW